LAAVEVRLLGEVAFSAGGTRLPVKGARQRKLLAALSR
jgi:hypothetical protein